ncbi:Lipopolysaccharide core heptosyltransferase RfaQ [Pigmentiphaga humi]|uniref:Lipopolysaccharide core heptosyltransferase RfaQ n=1 Tax=Pigmentiphaga humi TaxID=2478468 RepID=A0A3P4B3P7_9BURK|nr:glycosyltransferase family 9 protein [Pigmentiphaga humi]VCU70919.1 Lipopolysaccharide core heptosyltransferase RfaQ [Pigmentiphaga humi]
MSGTPTSPSHPIEQDWTVAFVMSRRIGDTLVSMVLVNNLMRHGIAVTVFSRHLDAMREWFPGVDIRPELGAAQARGELSRYDLVLHAYANDVVGDTRAWHPRAWVMDHWPTYRQVKPMVDIQLDVCRDCFGLADPTRDNGLVVPLGAAGVVIRNRVIIHPTASDLHKQWLPVRFLALARRLRKQGYEPWFVVAPCERADWHWIEAQGERLVAYASLADVAAWLATAGVFVGNDSGLAHLASNVGVPAVSLALRPRIALRWRPGWAPALAITAPPLMPGRWLREVSWKYLLPVSCVATAVERLRLRMAQTARAFGPEPAPVEAPLARTKPARTRPPMLSVPDTLADPRTRTH